MSTKLAMFLVYRASPDAYRAEGPARMHRQTISSGVDDGRDVLKMPKVPWRLGRQQIFLDLHDDRADGIGPVHTAGRHHPPNVVIGPGGDLERQAPIGDADPRRHALTPFGFRYTPRFEVPAQRVRSLLVLPKPLKIKCKQGFPEARGRGRIDAIRGGIENFDLGRGNADFKRDLGHLARTPDGGRGLCGDGNDGVALIADRGQNALHSAGSVIERHVTIGERRRDQLSAVRADGLAGIAWLVELHESLTDAR